MLGALRGAVRCTGKPAFSSADRGQIPHLCGWTAFAVTHRGRDRCGRAVGACGVGSAYHGYAARSAAKRRVGFGCRAGLRRAELGVEATKPRFLGRSERKEEENVKLHFKIEISRPLHPRRPRRRGTDDWNRGATAGISAGFFIEPGWVKNPEIGRAHV